MLAAWCSIQTLQHHPLSTKRNLGTEARTLYFTVKTWRQLDISTTNDNLISWHLTALRQRDMDLSTTKFNLYIMAQDNQSLVSQN